MAVNHKKRLEFVMNTKTDKKIINWLDTKPNKSAYIKSLIKRDMRENA